MSMNLTIEERQQAEWRISHGGHVPLHDFQIVLAVLFAVAAITCVGRISLRFSSLRRLYLDDAILLASFLCLIISTSLAYTYMYPWYLAFAWERGDVAAAVIARERIYELTRSVKNNEIYLGFTWTTIYGVKASYLAFFKSLVAASSRRIACFYWTLVGLTVVSYIFTLVGESVLPCTYNKNAIGSNESGSSPARDRLLVIMYWLYAITDASTDFLIVTIPIIILRKSGLPGRTKITLCIFLGLSAFMITCAIIRASYTWYAGNIDFPWQLFWRHIEACVAVIMASVTAYRMFVVDMRLRIRRSREAQIEKCSKRCPRGVSGGNEKVRSALKAIQFPRPTLTGMRTMLRTPSWDGDAEWTFGTIRSEKDLEYGPYQGEYHDLLRKTSH